MTVEGGPYNLPQFRPRPDWYDQAACDGLTDLMFPERGEEGGRGARSHAAEVCNACPVRVECLELALETGERHGYWGGLSAKARIELLARRNRKRGAA